MGTKIRNFTELNAWKEGHQLVLTIYKITDKFPKKETFVLVNQMLRSAVSVTSNIAEGFGKRTIKEKVQFYSMAQASLTELQNQLFISKDVGYIASHRFNEIWNQSVVVHKLITGLIKSLKR
jgi:four helix bundle protein